MSTAEVEIRRPQRWDTPYCNEMTDELVDWLLTFSPFREMNPSRFSAKCPLAGILKNDARIRELATGDILVREGDYGNSAFVLLQGTVDVLLESLPKKLLGRPQRSRKHIIKIALDQLFGSAPPEVRSYGQAQLDKALGWREDDGETRVFLQDVPGVLDEHNSIKLRRGEIFGELAAISRSPRTATIVASEPGVVLEIRWQGLRDMMRADSALKEHIDNLYRQNSLEAHLRETPILAKVPNELLAIIAAETKFESFGKFDWQAQFRKTSRLDVSERIHEEPLIAKEGDDVNGLILIRGGFARVSRRYGNGHQTLAYLGKGQAFGFEELAYSWSSGKPVSLMNSLRAVGYVDTLRIPTALIHEYVMPTLSSGSLRQAKQAVKERSGEGVEFADIADQQARNFESGLLEFLLDERSINGKSAMLINTDRCTRCDDCVRACASTHDHNPRFTRHGPQYGKFMVANACMQCVDPVCMIGCPTGAIGRDSATGNVLINDQTCIGCSTCANSCPYSNIQMVEIRSESGAFIRDSETNQPIVKATKCDLCVDAWGGPACQRACPHDALVRIDMSDNQSLMKWIRDNE